MLSAFSIVSYMVKQSLPAVSAVTAENFEEFKSMDKIVVVGYLGADDKKAEDAFKKFADAQRDNYLFGLTDDAALAEAEAVKQPAIVLYKDFDEKKAVYDGQQIDQDALVHWAKTASTPLVGVIGPDTYSGYMSVCICQAWLYIYIYVLKGLTRAGWYPVGIYFCRDSRGA